MLGRVQVLLSSPLTSPSLSPGLRMLSSCEEAAEIVRARALVRMNAALDENARMNRASWCANRHLAGAGPLPPAADGDGASMVSSTNNQVAGVDEADFIKNDSKYVYAAMNGALRIVQAWPAAEAREVAAVRLAGTPKKLFVQGDRALAYVSVPRMAASVNSPAVGGGQAGALPPLFELEECTHGYDCRYLGDGTSTVVVVFDISDRAAPRQLRSIELDGTLMAARRIGSAVHTVVVAPELSIGDVHLLISEDEDCTTQPDDPDREKKYEALRQKNTELIEHAVLKDFLPSVTENGTDYAQRSCDAVYRDRIESGASFTTLVSIDMAVDTEPAVTTVLSKPGPVYASSEALYVGVLADEAAPLDTKLAEPITSLHKFRIGSDIGSTGYVASGKVEGHVLYPFSLDERAGVLRVATSTRATQDVASFSTLSVLEQQGDKLNVVGTLEGIAPMQDIRSVRFEGDRGFIVTFDRTGPLWMFDLADPAAPKLAGELELPGFATYMKMLDATHLLTIGYDASATDDAEIRGVLLQIVDVSNPARPRRTHERAIGTRGSSSEALTNHLAFTLFENKLALPMTICEAEASEPAKLTFGGLMVFDLSVQSGITELGRVAHTMIEPEASNAMQDDAACLRWWSQGQSIVQRAVFMENFVYSVAQDVMRVQDVAALGRDVAAVPLND